MSHDGDDRVDEEELFDSLDPIVTINKLVTKVNT